MDFREDLETYFKILVGLMRFPDLRVVPESQILTVDSPRIEFGRRDSGGEIGRAAAEALRRLGSYYSVSVMSLLALTPQSTIILFYMIKILNIQVYQGLAEVSMNDIRTIFRSAPKRYLST